MMQPKIKQTTKVIKMPELVTIMEQTTHEAMVVFRQQESS